MKKTTLRLLVAAILMLATLGLLASCGAKTVTVTLMDGDTTVKTLTVDKGAAIEIDEDAIEKAGYELVDVYTDAAMTTPLEEGAVADADTTLYLKYKPNTYYIRVDNKNGTTPTNVSVTYGAAYTLTAPEREGYRFAGYEYNAEPFNLTGSFNYTNSIGITATWTEKLYLTVYNVTQKIGDPIEIAEDGSFTLPAVSNTEDAIFAGYLLDGVAFGTRQADGTYTGTYTGTSSAVVMQSWTPVPTYTMTVNMDGATAVAPLTGLKAGATYTLPAAPVREGYVFTGYTVDGEPIEASGAYTFGKDVTAVATWRKLVYITVFDGATQVGQPIEVAEDGSFTLPSVADTADNTFEGYLLNGQPFGTLQTNGTYTGTYTGTANINVFIKWEGVEHFFINIETEGAAIPPVEIGADGSYALPAAPTRAGYYFLGYTKDGEAFAATGTVALESITVTANWRRVATISVYSNGALVGTVTVAADGTYTIPTDGLTAPVFHVFGGFLYNNADFPATGTDTSGADKTVFVKWDKLPTVDVSLNAAGGAYADGEGNATTFLKSETALLPIPGRDGYTFDGYVYGAGTKLAGEIVDGKLAVDLSGITQDALVLTATWKLAETAGEVFGDPTDPTTTKNYFREPNGNDMTYVFLLGETYSFGTSTLAFPINDGVVEATAGGNGFTAKKIGSFSMTITSANGSTRTVLAKVTYRVDSTDPGTSTAGRDAGAFKNGLVTELKAGITNLRLDVNVSTGSGMLALDKIPYDILVKDQDGNVVTVYTINEDGSIDFDAGVLATAEKLTITITPKYALKRYVDLCSETVTVIPNGGVNVYTSTELYNAFADTSVTTINLMRTIYAEADPRQTYQGNGVNILNEWENGVYVRVPTAANDTVTINGNCYTVDASRIALLDPLKGGLATRHVGDPYSANNTYRLINVQAGIFTYYAADLNHDASADTPTLTVNDLFLHGNFNGNGNATSGEMNASELPLLVGSQSLLGIEVRHANLNLTNSRIDYTYTALYSNGFIGTNGDQPADPAKLRSTMTLDGVTLDHSFVNTFYSWGQTGVNAKNTYIGQSSGAAFHFDDSPILVTNPNGSYLNLADDVTIENYVTGTEAWFTAFNLNLAAPVLKKGVNEAIAPATITCNADGDPVGAVINSDGTESGTTYFNFIMVCRDDGFDDLAGNVTNEQGCVVSGGEPIPFVPVYKGTVPTPDKLLTDMYMGLAANDTSKIAGMNTMYVPGYDTPAGFVSLFVEAFIPGSN